MFNNFVNTSVRQKNITFFKKFQYSDIKTKLVFKVTASCKFFLLCSCFKFLIGTKLYK